MNAREARPVKRRQIADDIAALGAREGEVLYMRCGMQALGIPPSEVEDVLIGGIFDAIGPGGTLIGPAFVKTSMRWAREITVSNRETPPYTGAFSKLMLRQPGALRSTHPTHSFVGIGPHAREILEHHPNDGSCFEPMRKIVERDGLMALIGCVKASPGFSTVHLAQHDLGLTQQHYTKLFVTVRLGDANGPVFRPIESPGCSDNFGAFYKDYVEDGNFKSGFVGKAWSIAARAKGAYAVERAALERDPLYPICDKPECISCNVMRGYNKRAIPRGLLANLAKRICQRGAR